MNVFFWLPLVAASVFLIAACTEVDTSESDNNSLFDVTLTLQDDIGSQRSSFYPSETLRMRLNIENTSNSNYTLNFDDSQVADFEVLDSEGEVIWTWSEGQTFNTTASSFDLASGDDYGLRYDWNLLLEDSSVLPPGDYTAQAWFISIGEAATSNFSMLE